MNDALIDVLRGSCLVFCGYGGNDKSIAELLRCLPAKTMDWGGVGEGFPTGPVGVALRGRDETVVHVTHGDFDELMLEIAQEFKLNLPPFERFKKLEELYSQSLRRHGVRRSGSTAATPDVVVSGGAAAASRMSGTLDADRLVIEAIALRNNPGRADELFREAVAAAPDSNWVLGNYASFLSGNFPEEADRAEEYYRRAIEADPTHANNLGNLAQLLFVLGRDDEALEMLGRAARSAPAPDLSLDWRSIGTPTSPTSGTRPSVSSAGW